MSVFSRGNGRTALASGADSWHNETVRENAVIHTCPYCELRFLYMTEVKDHVMLDHPEHTDVVASAEPHEMPHGG